MKYTYMMDAKSIDAAIPLLGKAIATLTMNVQKLAVSVLRDFMLHGDKPTAVRRANALIEALGKGMKGQQLMAWMEQHAPLVYNKETKKLVAGYSAVSPVKDHTKIDLAACTADLWHDAMAEPEYKALGDWNAQLNALIKKAKADIDKMGDKSKVNRASLHTLEQLAAGVPLAPVVVKDMVTDTLA